MSHYNVNVIFRLYISNRLFVMISIVSIGVTVLSDKVELYKPNQIQIGHQTN